MNKILKAFVFFITQGFTVFRIFMALNFIWYLIFQNSNKIVMFGLFIIAVIWNCGMIKILTSEDSDDD